MFLTSDLYSAVSLFLAWALAILWLRFTRVLCAIHLAAECTLARVECQCLQRYAMRLQCRNLFDKHVSWLNWEDVDILKEETSMHDDMIQSFGRLSR